MASNLLSNRPCTEEEGRGLLQLADILVAQWKARNQPKLGAQVPPGPPVPARQASALRQSGGSTGAAPDAGRHDPMKGGR
jgi:hypothetical protein